MATWDERRKLLLGSKGNYIGQLMVSGHQKEVTEYFSILSAGKSYMDDEGLWRT